MSICDSSCNTWDLSLTKFIFTYWTLYFLGSLTKGNILCWLSKSCLTVHWSGNLVVFFPLTVLNWNFCISLLVINIIICLGASLIPIRVEMTSKDQLPTCFIQQSTWLFLYRPTFSIQSLKIFLSLWTHKIFGFILTSGPFHGYDSFSNVENSLRFHTELLIFIVSQISCIPILDSSVLLISICNPEASALLPHFGSSAVHLCSTVTSNPLFGIVITALRNGLSFWIPFYC